MRDQPFESGSLQEAICEPWVPEPYHSEFTNSIGTRKAVNKD